MAVSDLLKRRDRLTAFRNGLVTARMERAAGGRVQCRPNRVYDGGLDLLDILGRYGLKIKIHDELGYFFRCTRHVPSLSVTDESIQ